MKMHEVVTTLLACNAFSTKSFTYPIMEKTQSNILLSSVTSRIHITDSMALEWHISLAVYTLSRQVYTTYQLQDKINNLMKID